MIRHATRRKVVRIQPEMADWMTETSLVRLWRAMRSEVERHKWIESEKRGHDIGWDRAWRDWQRSHGSQYSVEFIRDLDRDHPLND